MTRVRMTAYGVVVLAICVLGGFAPAWAEDYKQIVVATGSPFELGLVQVLAKPFEKETGCVVRVIKTPTEPGLDLGRNGLAHITMGHSHEATAKFVKDGQASKRPISCTT